MSERTRQLLASEVRAWMGRKRVTQTEVAVRLGKSQSYVSRRLVGERPFTVDDLEGIADLCSCSVADLVNVLPRLDSNQQPAGYRFRAA